MAKEIRPGMLVNLGIGLPTRVANHLPPGMDVYLQAENGIVGLGVRPPEGMEDDDLTDAGRGFVTAVPGAAHIDSTLSFGLIRGGHLDMTVLGGLQVDARGLLASWMIPGKLAPGMGGAMAPRAATAIADTEESQSRTVPQAGTRLGHAYRGA